MAYKPKTRGEKVQMTVRAYGIELLQKKHNLPYNAAANVWDYAGQLAEKLAMYDYKKSGKKPQMDRTTKGIMLAEGINPEFVQKLAENLSKDVVQKRLVGPVGRRHVECKMPAEKGEFKVTVGDANPHVAKSFMASINDVLRTAYLPEVKMSKTKPRKAFS